jgi:hypothetical protein
VAILQHLSLACTLLPPDGLSRPVRSCPGPLGRRQGPGGREREREMGGGGGWVVISASSI